MQNPNRSLSTSGHRSPRVGQGTDATGVCLSRADGWNAGHLFTFPNHLVVSGMNAATFFA